MLEKNNWKRYDSNVEIDTDESALKKFMVRLRDGREVISCYSFVCFIDLLKGEIINDNNVMEYREFEDGEHI